MNYSSHRHMFNIRYRNCTAQWKCNCLSALSLCFAVRMKKLSQCWSNLRYWLRVKMEAFLITAGWVHENPPPHIPVDVVAPIILYQLHWQVLVVLFLSRIWSHFFWSTNLIGDHVTDCTITSERDFYMLFWVEKKFLLIK